MYHTKLDPNEKKNEKKTCHHLIYPLSFFFFSFSSEIRREQEFFFLAFGQGLTWAKVPREGASFFIYFYKYIYMITNFIPQIGWLSLSLFFSLHKFLIIRVDAFFFPLQCSAGYSLFLSPNSRLLFFFFFLLLTSPSIAFFWGKGGGGVSFFSSIHFTPPAPPATCFFYLLF